MGLPSQPTNTAESTAAYEQWVAAACQPNFYANAAGVNDSCPPYVPIPTPTYTPAPDAAAAAGRAMPPRRPRPANPHVSRFNHGACLEDGESTSPPPPVPAVQLPRLRPQTLSACVCSTQPGGWRQAAAPMARRTRCAGGELREGEPSPRALECCCPHPHPRSRGVRATSPSSVPASTRTRTGGGKEDAAAFVFACIAAWTPPPPTHPLRCSVQCRGDRRRRHHDALPPRLPGRREHAQWNGPGGRVRRGSATHHALLCFVR